MNPHLPAFVPRLRWHVEAAGWILLGFDRAPGRHLDVTPGSPDLPPLAGTLTAMAATRAPQPPVRIQSATARWADYVPPDIVAGNALVHTDMNTANFLVSGESIAVVDWAMPCRGASWLDTALMVVRLIRAGHAPAQAQRWAEQVPAWRAAPPGRSDSVRRRMRNTERGVGRTVTGTALPGALRRCRRLGAASDRHVTCITTPACRC